MQPHWSTYIPPQISHFPLSCFHSYPYHLTLVLFTSLYPFHFNRKLVKFLHASETFFKWGSFRSIMVVKVFQHKGLNSFRWTSFMYLFICVYEQIAIRNMCKLILPENVPS